MKLLLFSFHSWTYKCRGWINIPEMNFFPSQFHWQQLKKIDVLVLMNGSFDDVSMTDGYTHLCKSSEEKKDPVDQ